MNIEKAKQVVQEISEVCKKHGVYLVGTCWSEGMYSDIQIFEFGEIYELPNPYQQALRLLAMGSLSSVTC